MTNHIPASGRAQRLRAQFSPFHFVAFALAGCSAVTNGIAAASAATGAMCAVAVVASVSSDVLKSSLPVVIRRLLKGGEWATATACAMLLCVTMTFSGWQAMSAALGARIEASDGRAGIEADRTRLQASYDGAAAALKVLTASRPVGELQALVASGAGVDPSTWTRTAHCTDITRPASKEACQPFADASAELGRAQRRADLEAVVKGASAALASLPPPKVPDAGVVAAQRVLGLFGLSAATESIQVGAALLFVALLELGSALGFVVAEALTVDPGLARASAPALVVPEPALAASGAISGLGERFGVTVQQVAEPTAFPGPSVLQLHHAKLAAKIHHAKSLRIDARLKSALERKPFVGTMAELAAMCRTSASTIGRRLEALASAGLIRLDAQAGRGTRVELVRELRAVA